MLEPIAAQTPVRTAAEARRSVREPSSSNARVPRRAEAAVIDRSPLADGFLRPLSRPETTAISALLYPLRSAEALGTVVLLSAALWGFTVLVPEYCLGIQADADQLEASSMGWLIVLITAIPALLLAPLLVIYLLQYLGRVLLSSAQGDTVPPRTPDRNFEGFFHGLAPWLAWGVLGLGVGFLPAWWFASALPQSGASVLWLVVLIAVGLAYAETALLLSFFRDIPLAAHPPAVLVELVRQGSSLIPTLFKVTALYGLLVGFCALLLSVRSRAFWLYIPLSLVVWTAAVWTSLVAVRLLGLHQFRTCRGG